MRRLPPTRVEENVAALVGICPDYADDLLGSVDQPLQLRTDRATGREYLACDYNRDGESYRWVWMLFICKLRPGVITCYVEQIALVKRV